MTNGYLFGDESLLSKLSDNQNNKSCTLVYVRRGRGMYIVDGDLRGLNEGDIILLPPAMSFSFSASDLGDEYNINLSASFIRFDRAWLDMLISAFPVVSDLVLKVKEIAHAYFVKGPKWIKISSLLDELSSCAKADQPAKIFEILVQISTLDDLVLIRKTQPAVDVAQRKQKIDRYIECNYCNKLLLEEIAEYVGMSRIYFCNFFKTHYKEGFVEYINRLRVEKAVVLLVNTDKTIEQIAHECGFKTVQYFTRSFGKVRQMTPGAFRRSSRKN